MSGGHFDYQQLWLNEIANELEQLIMRAGREIPRKEIESEWYGYYQNCYDDCIVTKNYPDYDDLREQYEEGNISAVDFVTQQSDELTEDYERYCKEKSLDPNSEASAQAFMAYRDELFEESLSN